MWLGLPWGSWTTYMAAQGSKSECTSEQGGSCIVFPNSALEVMQHRFHLILWATRELQLAKIQGGMGRVVDIDSFSPWKECEDHIVEEYMGWRYCCGQLWKTQSATDGIDSGPRNWMTSLRN